MSKTASPKPDDVLGFGEYGRIDGGVIDVAELAYARRIDEAVAAKQRAAARAPDADVAADVDAEVITDETVAVSV